MWDRSRCGSTLDGVIFLVFSGAYFYFSDNLPPGGPFDQVGTSFLPKLLAGVLAGLSLLLIIVSKLGTDLHIESEPPVQENWIGFYGTLAMSFLSLVLWMAIGFATTPLLMAGIMLVNGTKNLRLVIAVAVGGTLVLYGLFFQLFSLPLPLGLLE